MGGIIAHRPRPATSIARIVSPLIADDELLQRCKAGEAAAWSQLVRRYQRLVYTIPLRAGLGEDTAADVFQATFSRLFQHLDSIRDASRVRAWLVTTAKRETLHLLDQIRQRHEQAWQQDEGDPPGASAEALADPTPGAEDQLAELQEHDRLRWAVDQLDPRSRQFIELAFLQDEPLSYADLSARLGMAENSIGPTRQRCLAKLRLLLAQV